MWAVGSGLDYQFRVINDDESWQACIEGHHNAQRRCVSVVVANEGGAVVMMCPLLVVKAFLTIRQYLRFHWKKLLTARIVVPVWVAAVFRFFRIVQMC